ncbi:hypothetical protein [Erythrobacter sp. R86502]|uniref:hypothetical protein n=1 Tax=Erythrobacter sp. R86502 TaxID=3093846 RepID=UPI0036D228CA
MNLARRSVSHSLAVGLAGLVWRRALPLVALLAATGASAEGFAIADLTPIGDAAAAALGPGYIFRAEPKRVSLYCAECTGSPMIDILLGTDDYGAEESLRLGLTSAADVERKCRSRNAGCRIKALDIAPAVGWVSQYPRPRGDGATAYIMRDGQVLTLRVISSSTGTSSEVMERLLPLARRQIIGR